MELIPVGPVLFIDTAGLDDDTELGSIRVKKSLEMLKRTDFALYVMDGNDIKSADATYDGNSNSVDSKEPVVSLTLKNDAIDKWYKATSDALANGESIGIYYDDKFISVPIARSFICQ